jgi:DNA-binding CsgD family transcriptional regulator
VVVVKTVSSVSGSQVFSRRLTGESPGLLALTFSLQPIHINHAAVILLKKLGASSKPRSVDQLPLSVKQLAQEMLERVHEHPQADWGQLYVSHHIAKPPSSFYVQAFVVPDEVHVKQSRIMLFLEERRLKRDTVATAENRFQLTDRETDVLMHLAQGFTNKEIGVTLGISEQTVKEHLKHIMEKTHCTTRTGVLMQLLQHA